MIKFYKSQKRNKKSRQRTESINEEHIPITKTLHHVIQRTSYKNNNENTQHKRTIDYTLSNLFPPHILPN